MSGQLPLASVNSATIQKPIQVVQPLQSGSAPVFQQSVSIAERDICNQSARIQSSTCLTQQALIQSSGTVMTSPISGSVTPFISTGGVFSATTGMVPSLTPQQVTINQFQPSQLANNGTCRAKQSAVAPSYVYQSLPMGQQIVLTNSGSSGILFAPPSMGAMPTSYVIAPANQQMSNQPQMVPLSSAQLVRGPMPVGTMAVMLPQQAPSTLNGPSHSGFVQMPDNRFTQPVVSRSCLPAMQSSQFQNQEQQHCGPHQSPILPASKHNLGCSSPGGVTLQHPMLNQCISQVSPGMTLTQLPNGAFALTPVCQMTATPPMTTQAPRCAAGTLNLGQGAPAGVSGSSLLQPAASSLASTGSTPSAVEVLRQLDIQIADIKRLSSPTSAQSNRLNDLVRVRDRLKATTNFTNNGDNNTFSMATRAMRPLANAALGRPRPPLQPRPVTLTPNVRNEVIQLLSQKRLYPITHPGNTSTTVLVEFRLSSQRYKVHLTRSEKVELERLLLSLPASRQAEVLAFYQQEQASALYAARFSVCYSAQSPRQPSVMTTCSGQSLVSQSQLVTAVSVAGSGGPSYVSSSSVMPQTPHRLPALRSAVGAAAISCGSATGAPGQAIAAGTLGHGSQPVHILPTRLPLVPVSSTTPIGMCMLTPVTPSSSALVMSNTPGGGQQVRLSGASLAASSTTTPPTSTTNSTSSASSVIRPATLTIQQASRLTNLRSLLHADHGKACARPPCDLSESKDSVSRSAKQLPTSLDMLERLVPYHVFQDRDNTPQAIAKVDSILEKAFKQLNTRKRQTEEAVISIMYSQKWRLMECEAADRLVISRMALDLEKEVFEEEKANYKSLLLKIDSQFPPVYEGDRSMCHLSGLRSLLNSADFKPLTFDKFGNARIAQPALEVESTTFNAAAEGVISTVVVEDEEEIGTSSTPPSLSDCQSVTSGRPSGGGVNGVDQVAPPSLVSEVPEEDLVTKEPNKSDSLEYRLAPKFDEGFPRWPEWTPDNEEEEDEDVDGAVGNVPEMDITGLVVEDDPGDEGSDCVVDGNADSRSLPSLIDENLKNVWDPCRYPMANGLPGPSSHRSQSGVDSLSVKLGQHNEVQHSEDPDLDAAIRSIIG